MSKRTISPVKIISNNRESINGRSMLGIQKLIHASAQAPISISCSMPNLCELEPDLTESMQTFFSELDQKLCALTTVDEYVAYIENEADADMEQIEYFLSAIENDDIREESGTILEYEELQESIHNLRSIFIQMA